MPTILTKKPKESLFDLKYYVSEIKYFLKKKIQGNRGPQVVIDNLIKGLEKNDVDFVLDPNAKEIKSDAKICVIRDIGALKFVIDFKNKNPESKIFAGPNIITTPNENNFIIFDEQIDKIIVPSQWVKDFYKSFNESGDKKIEVWPVGVNIPENKSTKKGAGIVYKKNIPDVIYNEIKKYLDSKDIKYEILEYGNFKQQEYFNLLEKAPWMIYLQESESQGLAMFEAWSYDVPTLVLQNNSITLNGYEVNNEKISSPYLNEGTGVFLRKDNLDEDIDIFINNINLYNPREFIIRGHTLELSAQKYLNIINANN